MTLASNDWNTAPIRHVEAAGTRFAYRRLGPTSGVPVVMLNHWGANLDNFDPPIVAGLATDRTVYAIDYRGIGRSGGEPPLTVAAMASDMVMAIRDLGLEQVDLVGFSLGGFVAQQIMLDAPTLVRRAILAGTGPAGGLGINKIGAVSMPLILKGLLTFRDPKTYLFFTSSSEAGERASRTRELNRARSTLVKMLMAFSNPEVI